MLAGMHSLPWMIADDFNEILLGEDKYGGRVVNTARALRFQECLNNCGMIDLGFSGPRYTWSNHHPLSHLIQERIDRAYANADWNVLYPNASVKHLKRAHSDHNPILLSFVNVSGIQLTRSFRYQPMWLSHPSFPEIVREAWVRPNDLSIAINNFTTKAKLWNKEHFGNIYHRKKRASARLHEVQVALANRQNNILINLEKSLRAELIEISKQEEEFWNMKARLSWTVEGDRNISFFHTLALVRRR